MINESDRSSLETYFAMKIRQEIASGNIKIDKKDIGFAISRNGEEIEYSDESNEEFFQNLEKAAQTFGRTTQTEEK